MRIQLSWEDPVTGEHWEPVMKLPVALGSKREKMPNNLDGQPVDRVLLQSKIVSRFHDCVFTLCIGLLGYRSK
ncbi:hypothetical protein [Scytonema sp. UIC 10036]|uniref:hypothetical protein n=1 Tax=Scytonema sp. UIC 10036 TaxID=2304196 RepID=UPI00140F9A67|nr:hypothetical protein [Scytonema sp. UIC 10036]